MIGLRTEGSIDSRHRRTWGPRHRRTWGPRHRRAWGPRHRRAWGPRHRRAWGSRHCRPWATPPETKREKNSLDSAGVDPFRVGEVERVYLTGGNAPGNEEEKEFPRPCSFRVGEV